MHIAIIGAGISGLMSALELVEQGCTISIFDQQQAGQAASWAGGGILSPMYPWRYVHAVNQLAQFGKSLLSSMEPKALPCYRNWFWNSWHRHADFDEEDFDVGLSYAEQHQEPMQRCEYLQRDALEQVNPHISEQFQEAIYFPELSNIRNPRVLQSLISYLKQHQMLSFENTPVKNWFNKVMPYKHSKPKMVANIQQTIL